MSELRFLWTDWLFLMVLCIAIITIIRAWQREDSQRNLKAIIHQPKAISTGLILLLFLIIAVLDSIHVHHVHGNQSLLDLLLYPLGSVYEQSYSKPLALTLFTPETVLIDGVTVQVHQPLKYINKDLTNTSQVLWFCAKALTMAFIISLSLMTALSLLYKRLRHHSIHPTAFWTLAVMIFAVLALFLISRGLHVFGTGKIGQDIFYHSIKSVRTGMVIGLLTTLFMLPLAIFLGIAAGYFGGLVDDLIQYIYTTISSIPGVLLITAAVLSIQTWIANRPELFQSLEQRADARLLALCLILGLTSWTSLCRLLRAESMKLKEIDYVLAAKALGSRSFWIIRKHLLPNVMHIVLITLVLDFSFLVLAEAVLSYVGVGVSPMTISWGNMINGARLELAREPVVWWPILAAFLMMFLMVLSANLFADVVRDAFDPHRQARH